MTPQANNSKTVNLQEAFKRNITNFYKEQYNQYVDLTKEYDLT